MIRLFTGLLLSVATFSTLAAPDGEQLYTKHCASCHQTKGHGGIGLPLTKAILDGVSDIYLAKSIRYGRPGRIMPAFPEMSDAQIDAIVIHMRKITSTKDTIFPATPIKGDIKLGEKLFAKHCAECHGEDGSGEGKGTGVTMSRSRKFRIMPAAIANSGFLASASDHLIRHITVEGREEVEMPAFKKEGLSDADFDNLVAYIRTIGEQQARPETLDKDERPSILLESPYDFDATVKSITQALKGSNFRIFPARYLEQGLIDEFNVNKRQIGIRFCNFQLLYGMLKTEPRLGTVLPCRITVMERPDGKVLLVAPNLRVVSRWFNNDELVELWDAMQETFNEMIEVATL